MFYYSRYGLEFNPFAKTGKATPVETKEYKEALYRLQILTQTKGFGVLTGGVGCGKTTIVRSWTTALNASLYQVVYSCISNLSAFEFYQNLARELGLEPARYKSKNFRLIQDEILRLSTEKKKTPVIIIDEANYIRNATLNELRLLFNFDMDSSDRAIILLTGLPSLNSAFSLSVNEPLKQRLIMNYNLEGLSKEEGRYYIGKKLTSAKCNQKIFDDAAIEAVLNVADGTPRIVDKLCYKCLLIGDAEKADIITSEVAMRAIQDCELG